MLLLLLVEQLCAVFQKCLQYGPGGHKYFLDTLPLLLASGISIQVESLACKVLRSHAEPFPYCNIRYVLQPQDEVVKPECTMNVIHATNFPTRAW
jgi:hypothetical protein